MSSVEQSEYLSEGPGVDLEADEQPTYSKKDVKDWTVEEVGQWLNDKGFVEESALFQAEKLCGKSLAALDKSDLKEVGITTMGRRIEIMSALSKLFSTTSDVKEKPTESDTGSKNIVWMKKVTKENKQSWPAALKNLYKIKTAVILREVSKLWPGNTKMYFKQNEPNRLKLEEVVRCLADTCTIQEIGFGREAIRSHILQWAQEKNRRLTDGYDYETKHTPAKRAKLKREFVSPEEVSSCTDTGTDGEPDEELGEPSEDAEDMSKISSQIIIMDYFKVNSVRAIGVKGHLLPLGKKLGVKTRSYGKYDVIRRIAKKLVSEGYVVINNGSNFKHLRRDQVNVIKSVPESMAGKAEMASSPSSSISSGGDTDILNESTSSDSDNNIPLSQCN